VKGCPGEWTKFSPESTSIYWQKFINYKTRSKRRTIFFLQQDWRVATNNTNDANIGMGEILHWFNIYAATLGEVKS